MPGDQRLDRDHVRRRLIRPRDNAGNLRELGQGGNHHTAELVVVDDDAGTFPRHHLGKGRTCKRCVEQQHVGPDAFARGQRIDETAMIAAHDAHHLGRPTGKLLQCGRQCVGPVVEFAIAQHTEFIDHGRMVWAASRRHRDPDGVRDTGACDRGTHPQVLVRTQPNEQPGVQQGAKGFATLCDLHGPHPRIGKRRWAANSSIAACITLRT